MKPNKQTLLTTVLGIFLATGLAQNVLAEDDMMGGGMGNTPAQTTDTTNTDQMAADHDQMKKDHDMMMKGHKGSSQNNSGKMGKKPAPAQNSGGGMMDDDQMGTGSSSQGTSNSMGGGMSDM